MVSLVGSCLMIGTLILPGVNRTVLAINGQYPGPLIRVNRGDTVLVNLTNLLPNATTLHWHGLFQNGTNWMDGTAGITQCPVPPGQSFLYNFTVQNQFGTYWYHAHVATQYVDGIVGPLIIHAPEEVQTQAQYDYDQVILVQDWYHDLTSALVEGYLASGNENVEPVPDNGLIQGENYFNCSSYDSDSGYECADNSTRPTFSFQQNKRYRLRFINTGAFTTFQISVDNHTLAVIEADGTLVSPLSVHRLEIATAQRYSVILHTNQSSSSNYWLRAQMNTACYAANNPVLDPDVMALITYTNSTTAPTNSVDWTDALDLYCQDLNSTLLTPITIEQAPPSDVLYEVSFSFQIGDNALDRGFINGSSWRPSSQNPTINQAFTGLQSSNVSLFTTSGVSSSAFSADQFVISLPSNQKVIDLLILNFDDGAHPFHFHGHEFWVMTTSAASTEQYFPWNTDLYSQLNSTTANDWTRNPMRRDTLTIGSYSWALIRFNNWNAGMWAFHCHNAWHMEAGLLMQFMSRADIMKEWSIPADVEALCKG
jgi:FtsP/CotA-like multicopper oxidase with cupredoxin domain